MISCENCGRENEDEYKFCLGCGSALPDDEPADDGPTMIDCPHCGTTIPNNFKFCGACGGAISAKQPSADVDKPAIDATAETHRSSGPASAGPAGPGATTSGRPHPPEQSSTAPADEVVGRLIVIQPDGTEGAEIALTAGEHVIGRQSDRAALADDPFLSPEHATFSFTGDGFDLEDDDSLNGVFVRIRDAVELDHGDHVRLGQELLRFERVSEVEPTAAHTEDGTDLDGSSAASAAWGRLCLVAGPDLVSRAFPLDGDATTIGRENGDILFRDDGFVSASHARIGRRGDAAVIEDLGSSNGTFRRIKGQTSVDDGDLLLMGQQLFRLVVM